MAQTFQAAELYWVSPEMTEVITTLAPSIPDCLPQPPVPDAALVMAFGRSVPGTDAETGETIYTSGNPLGHHQSVPSMGTVHGLGDLPPGVILVFMYQALTPKEQERFREVYPSRLMPTGGSEWQLDAMTSEFIQLADMPDPEVRTGFHNGGDRRLLATSLLGAGFTTHRGSRPSSGPTAARCSVMRSATAMCSLMSVSFAYVSQRGTVTPVRTAGVSTPTAGWSALTGGNQWYAKSGNASAQTD